MGIAPHSARNGYNACLDYPAEIQWQSCSAGENPDGRGAVMSLEITIRKRDAVTILDLQGQVTAGQESDSLGNCLQELAGQGAKKVLINLAKVEKMDTSGISSIVRAFVSLGRDGGKLALLNARGRVRMVLDMTRLLNVFPNFEDEALAVLSLG
jgi:anti-anti-sigma factor